MVCVVCVCVCVGVGVVRVCVCLCMCVCESIIVAMMLSQINIQNSYNIIEIDTSSFPCSWVYKMWLSRSIKHVNIAPISCSASLETSINNGSITKRTQQYTAAALGFITDKGGTVGVNMYMVYYDDRPRTPVWVCT